MIIGKGDVSDYINVSDFEGKVDGSGTKFGHRDKKNRLSLVPPLFIKILGWVFTYGAVKYADNNWMKGLKWSDVYEASLRHQLDFWDGMDLDDDSRLEHLAHAFWGLGILLYYAHHPEYKQFDDRIFSEGEQGEAVIGTTKMYLFEPDEEKTEERAYDPMRDMYQKDSAKMTPLAEAIFNDPKIKGYLKDALDASATSKDITYAWEIINEHVREELEREGARRLVKDLDPRKEGDGTTRPVS